ncbi:MULTISPECIES: cyclopropane-fatty-acyl-phospholipid synthase family protein [unclassified Rhizobium]|uniref:SAM-dependent methyltransferase n=1 Tax=unclassified Rhizobium TaxID=2613769 RepID=UPI00160B4159|nr:MULTISPECIES: class I SAM-dependent methyltransferase [unclassified Rhizobium]MBB3319309.1 SAM-dependent methyltransferase [Rhizobium sp. BK181]MCS4094979.1 SAM-dependent methyltransferase [Rhizobium sp. BK176]
MSEQDASQTSDGSGFYGPQYSRTDGHLAAEIRREVFGDDIGQESWRSSAEQHEIGNFLALNGESRVLDVACGAGGPSLALVEHLTCSLVGLDLEAEGVAHGNALAQQRGLADRVTFAVCDCSAKLPFEDSSFDAILCIDALCHLPNRFEAISDWARLLCAAGRLVFTDPFVVTGALSKGDVDGRSALGANLFFVPPGLNEEAIAAAGLNLLNRLDRADAVAVIGSRWHDARHRRADVLRREEGDAFFERRQLMLATAARLAKDKRLSRFLYVAEKPL